jgi:hypothetical protein
MTHAQSPGHHSSNAGGTTASVPFPAGEWEALQADDRQTAKYIVCLMTGIFILGLIGYLIIDLIVA